MITLTMLEKAANRLVTLVRVVNLYSNTKNSKCKTEFRAMCNLLKCMDIEVSTDWNKDVTKITRIAVSLDGEMVERII